MSSATCAICGKSDDWTWRYAELVGVDICDDCADSVANGYQKLHGGQWLTWANPPADKGYQKGRIPHHIRKAVYERDKYRCVTCGTHIDLSLDHIKPESKGGETTEENLRTMCRPCNSRKGARE